MTCAICGKTGHNRKTCPDRHPRITIPEVTEDAIASAMVVMGRVGEVIVVPTAAQREPLERLVARLTPGSSAIFGLVRIAPEDRPADSPFAGLTYGEIGEMLCALRAPEDAAEFWREYVEYLSRPDAKLLGQSPEHVARSNIGYLMGYYDAKARLRVYGLFEAFSVGHPIFGREEPTPIEAFGAGVISGATGDEA